MTHTLNRLLIAMDAVRCHICGHSFEPSEICAVFDHVSDLDGDHTEGEIDGSDLFQESAEKTECRSSVSVVVQSLFVSVKPLGLPLCCLRELDSHD
jgi:hypothetical protein